MGKRGPKPAPRHLKVVKGERSDRVPDKLPTPEVELTRPGWLLPEAKREWTRIVDTLSGWGLAVVDRGSLAAYCQEWAHYVDCQKAIQEAPSKTFTVESGYQQQIPEISMANNHLSNMRRLAAEFGMTLSARGNVQLPGSESEAGDGADLLNETS